MTSLILIPYSQKAIITPGIIPVYRQMINYTMSNLKEAEELYADLLSETDKKAFLRICIDSYNSSNSLQPRTIEVTRETHDIGTTQLNGMIFCTPEEPSVIHQTGKKSSKSALVPSKKNLNWQLRACRTIHPVRILLNTLPI